jgi:hypothetical protein
MLGNVQEALKKACRLPAGIGGVEVRSVACPSRHPELSTQHFNPNTGGSRPARRLPLFACPIRESRKRAPRSWPACGGFPPLRDRRAGGKDSLRSVFRLFRPPAAPFRRRHRGNSGKAVIDNLAAPVLSTASQTTGELHPLRKGSKRSGNFSDLAAAVICSTATSRRTVMAAADLASFLCILSIDE